MFFYDIKINSMPSIAYNCAVSGERYKARLRKNDGIFELAYVESGEYIFSRESVAVHEAGHLYPVIFDREAEIYTEQESQVRIISVGVRADISVSLIDSESLSEKETQEVMQNMLGGNRFLIARDGMSVLQFDWLSDYMKRIAACSCGERVGEESRALSLWLELMSRITKSSMSLLALDLNAVPTSSVAYGEMAVAYIIKNYKSKITVSSIAEALDLSPNYLHAVFKQVRGTTIIDYLTSYRMKLARVYIERFGMRVSEAAEAVGIDDPAYFSRLFKKTFGKSVNALKK